MFRYVPLISVIESEADDQSLIAQGSEFPLRKPPGFHWDFFLLGFVIFGSGILGLPASNGLSLFLQKMIQLTHQV
jgi:hypothetical protein